MPSTPIEWTEFNFNPNTNLGGNQSSTRITQLANGNVLICWIDLDETVGSAGGSAGGADVIGRIFDPLGNPVSAEIRLNVQRFGDNEQDADITALANGGFVVVYEDNNADNDLAFDTYDDAGVRLEGGILAEDVAGGDVPNSPAIASASPISVMMAYIVNNANGSEDVLIRRYNPVTDALGVTSSAFFGAGGVGEGVGGIGLTTLSNDTYALVVTNRNNGDDTIVLRILDAAGALLNSATISPGIEIGRIQCVGLTGGNVAIVYENLTSGTIVGAVYSSTATLVESSAQISNIAGGQLRPAVAALANGGYVVVWDDNSNSDIRGQRFNSAGDPVGNEFIIDAVGTQSAPSVVGLADGRFQISWTEDGNILSEIYDPRDGANAPPVYPPSRWQVGTVGNDVFTATTASRFVHGWLGDDIITTANSFFSDRNFGDDGNDTIIVTTVISNDEHYGGEGNDTIDWSRSNEASGAVYDLALGTATDDFTVEIMAEFENLIGTPQDDMILGSDVSNMLNGGAGDDTLNGRGGVDTLNGFTGDDLFFVDNAADVVIEGPGGVGDILDRLAASVSYVLGAGVQVEQMQTTSSGGTGAIDLRGNALAQSIFGNAGDNVLHDGGAGEADTLTGLAGNDTYIVNNAGTIINEGVGQGTDDRVAASVDFVLAADDRIELLTTTSSAGVATIDLRGNALAQSIFGNAGDNVLHDGGAGAADTLTGSAGDDTYIVNNADTVIVEGAGGGTNDRVAASVSFKLAGDDNIERLTTTSSGAVTAINLTGNSLAQSILGNAGANRINGAAGSDTLTGGDGADVFVFNAPTGSTNVDTITDYSFASDTIELRAAGFTGLAAGALAGAAFRVNTTGLADDANDRIIYETDSGRLYFDADGIGATARVQFAVLDSGLVLTSADFVVA